jgi:hypothetical protein
VNLHKTAVAFLGTLEAASVLKNPCFSKPSWKTGLLQPGSPAPAVGGSTSVANGHLNGKQLLCQDQCVPREGREFWVMLPQQCHEPKSRLQGPPEKPVLGGKKNIKSQEKGLPC